jgi:hypothetical protein
LKDWHEFYVLVGTAAAAPAIDGPNGLVRVTAEPSTLLSDIIAL